MINRQELEILLMGAYEVLYETHIVLSNDLSDAIISLQDADAQGSFCDNNCTWMDHHPDCTDPQPEQDAPKSVLKAIAEILRKAQGVTDAETGIPIDVGAECVAIRGEFEKRDSPRITCQIYGHEVMGCSECTPPATVAEEITEDDARNILGYTPPEDNNAAYYYSEGWNACLDEIAAAPDAQGEAVAEIVIESDYWSRGHFYEGRKKDIKLLKGLGDVPVGTKLYAAPTPEQQDYSEQALELVAALERIANMDSMSYHSLDSAKITARDALAAHREQEREPTHAQTVEDSKPCHLVPLPSGDAIGGLLCTTCAETFEREPICPKYSDEI